MTNKIKLFIVRHTPEEIKLFGDGAKIVDDRGYELDGLIWFHGQLSSHQAADEISTYHLKLELHSESESIPKVRAE